MKRTTAALTLLLVQLLGVPGLAQGQGTPPPEIPILPPTPAQAEQDTAAKRETLPPLALPDIVIFGRGSATVREGSKLFPTEKRTVLDREVGAPLGEKGTAEAGDGVGRLMAAEVRLPASHNVRAWARGGTFGEANLGADYWGTSDRLTLTAHANLERTDGHVAGSGAGSGSGRVAVLRALTPFTQARIRAAYAAGRQEEWGLASPLGAQRGWYAGSYDVEFESTARRGLTLRVAAGGRHAGLKDDSRTGTPQKPSFNGGFLEGSAEMLTGRFLLDARARLEGDRLSGSSPPQSARLAGARLTATTLSGTSTSIMLGAVAYRSETGLGPAFRIWPLARLTARYSDRFGMYAMYEPGMHYLTMGEARRENPYLANSFRIVPTEERFHLVVGIAYELTDALSLGFEVARRIFDRLPVWRLAPPADNSDGLFILDGLVDVSVDETRLTLEGSPFADLELQTELLLRRPIADGLSELPHIPRMEVSLTAGMPGPFGVRLESSLRHLGTRYGENTGTPGSRLDAGTDLILRVSRNLGGTVMVWLEARNLMGADLTAWQGYLLPGRTSALGLSVRF